MKNIWMTLAVAAGFALLPTAARADLFNDLSSTLGGSDSIGTSYGYGPLAESFSTSTSSFSFNSISLVLDALIPTDGDSFTISLLSNATNAPGSVLETLATVNDSSLTTNFVTYTFNGPTFTLAASTQYWIELSSANSSAGWFWTLSDSGTGVPGGSFYIAQMGGVFPNSDGPYLMAIPGVSLTTAPEAGTLVSLMLGLGALFLVSRKRLLQS